MTKEELKLQRQELMYSQRMLGEALGASRNTVVAWESGRRPVPKWMKWAIIGLRAVKA